jgi:transcriptional regulator with XRE-family HTH domain
MKLQKDEVVKKIGIKIREIRLEKKLTIEKVALESEIEYTQLSRIELGKISHTLSVPVPEIFQSLYY